MYTIYKGKYEFLRNPWLCVPLSSILLDACLINMTNIIIGVSDTLGNYTWEDTKQGECKTYYRVAVMIIGSIEYRPCNVQAIKPI